MKFILIILFFWVSQSSCADKSGSGIDPDKFMHRPAESVLLDVRTPEEFSEGHIKDAVNINWEGDDFENAIAGMDKSKPVYVYCRSGRRSAAASEFMVKKGFAKVYNLKGGLENWKSAGLPVEK